MRYPLAVQHHGHKITLLRTSDGVVVRQFLLGWLVKQETIEAPFHVLLDLAHDWVHKQKQAVPADRFNLEEL